MLTKELLDKLQYFNSEKFSIHNDRVVLKENKKDGSVVLECQLNQDTLVFHEPEKNTLPYLDEAKKNAKASPDKFLFEFHGGNECDLHIMEFKKTINTWSIKKSKIQMIMGIYNARAVAGFLNIAIRNIFVYSAYRNDQIESIEDDKSINIRAAISNKEDQKLIRDWKRGVCVLKLDNKEKIFKHEKIQLDQNGTGNCTLESNKNNF